MKNITTTAMPALHALFCAALAMTSVSSPFYCNDNTMQVVNSLPPKRWSWNDCGTPESPVQITDAQYSLDRPTPGDNLTITIKGTSGVDIEDGAYLDVLLKMEEFVYIDQAYPLCDGSSFNTSCPLKAGTHEIVNTIAIPDTMPVASYYARFNAYSAGHDELGCVEFHVKLIQG
ncbi:hypothetical protein NM688_g6185 [Phlebia brevispora]|uniref:Uncharacterized protein n=1 Tax=Phlebia brevispora TaxID=194682 RepID=A0ACC1SJ89_9APHY|nr:hypothetical protein NM688_g6185 [Phlebia brevispora]